MCFLKFSFPLISAPLAWVASRVRLFLANLHWFSLQNLCAALVVLCSPNSCCLFGANEGSGKWFCEAAALSFKSLPLRSDTAKARLEEDEVSANRKI